jgi:hypothetical protein
VVIPTKREGGSDTPSQEILVVSNCAWRYKEGQVALLRSPHYQEYSSSLASSTMAQPVQGKTAIVTGAGSGMYEYQR